MTTKVIVAVSGDTAGLRGDRIRQACATAGATRLQINISDDAVAGAMRITETRPRIDAVLSLWFDEAADIDSAVAAVVAEIGAADRTFAAWSVTERAPLDPELPRDGSRVEALSNIAFLRRPDDMPYDQWQQIWLGEHTTVAIETQATFGYYQNIVDAPLDLPGLRTIEPPVAAIVEELFPMAAVSDFHAFYGSGGDQAELESRMTRMVASVQRFGADRNLDVVPTSRYEVALGDA